MRSRLERGRGGQSECRPPTIAPNLLRSDDVLIDTSGSRPARVIGKRI
jgi:hypothetical protein